MRPGLGQAVDEEREKGRGEEEEEEVGGRQARCRESSWRRESNAANVRLYVNGEGRKMVRSKMFAPASAQDSQKMLLRRSDCGGSCWTWVGVGRGSI